MPSSPSPVYPAVSFQVLNVNHVFLRQDRAQSPGNSSVKTQTQTFLITGSGSGPLQPVVTAAYGPLMVDAPVSLNQFASGPRIVAVILARQVRSSSPVVKILFHMPTDAGLQTEAERLRPAEGPKRKGPGAKAKDGAQCVTAYAFWETREVRGACLVSPGKFCVAQLKPEPAWFSSAGRSGSSTRDVGRMEGAKVPQGNVVEVYFQSRREPTGQCSPQDSLQRIGVGRGRDAGSSGTPMRRIGSVSLLKSPPGNPTFYRLRLGGAVVIQTSSKPLKMTDVATFYVFLTSTSTVETFTLRWEFFHRSNAIKILLKPWNEQQYCYNICYRDDRFSFGLWDEIRTKSGAEQLQMFLMVRSDWGPVSVHSQQWWCVLLVQRALHLRSSINLTRTLTAVVDSLVAKKNLNPKPNL